MRANLCFFWEAADTGGVSDNISVAEFEPSASKREEKISLKLHRGTQDLVFKSSEMKQHKAMDGWTKEEILIPLFKAQSKLFSVK